MKNLLSCKILSDTGDGVQFKYPYIFYFFAAKRIAETIAHDPRAKQAFSELLNTLHREDSANIIIFITHHTKDNWILDEIQVCIMELFSESDRATLEAPTLSFMKEFMDEIPTLVIEHKKVFVERRKHNIKLDQMEDRRKAIQKEVERVDSSELLAKVNKVFKCLEIVGQIARNRHGSLTRDALTDLTEESLSCGLRFLHYFLTISDTAKEEVIKMIASEMEDNPSASSQNIEREARHLFMSLTYQSIYGVIRKMASSLGSAELSEVFAQIENKWGTPAIKLVCEAIQLQFEKRLDFSRLADMKRDFLSNGTCTRLLRELVVQHTYMFPVDYKDKQRVSQTLGIPVATQQLMSRTRKS